MLNIFQKKKKQLPVRFWSGKAEQKAALTKEDARFIFEQAEKMLRNSVDTSNIIASRTNTLITIISGLLGAFIGYLITRLKNGEFDSLVFIAIVSALYLFVLAFFAFENTRDTAYFVPGSLPEDMIISSMPSYIFRY